MRAPGWLYVFVIVAAVAIMAAVLGGCGGKSDSAEARRKLEQRTDAQNNALTIYTERDVYPIETWEDLGNVAVDAAPDVLSDVVEGRISGLGPVDIHLTPVERW